MFYHIVSPTCVAHCYEHKRKMGQCEKSLQWYTNLYYDKKHSENPNFNYKA